MVFYTVRVVISGGSGGVITTAAGSNSISLSSLTLNAGQTATITVDITNVPGQSNPNCGANPTAFTNSVANFSSTSNNLSLGGVGNVCLVIPCPANAGVVKID